MKKLFVFLMCLSLCAFAFAQSVRVTQNSFQKVAVSIAPGTLSADDITVPEGVFSTISLKDCGPSNNPGAPQLPVLVKFLQIPVCESVVATVTNAQYTEYDAAALGITHPLYPNQPSVSKSAARPPFSYDNAVYTTDEFYSLPLVSVENTGVQRDKALATMYVSPVQYNPVTQKIRVYSQIDVEFTFVNANMAMTQQLQKYVSPMFAADKSLLLNEQANPFKAEFSTSPIKYLIIANSMFSGNADLEAFANWKRRLGYKVEIAYTSDASVGTTTTSIKNYIQNKYNNATAAEPAPTFLLFIGDVEQMPSFAGTTGDSHSTDLYYATLSGSDNIPDCYYGRLSATNASELKNQLDKIMMYEQYTMPDPSYLGKAVLIAGTDDSWSPTHADGQINYVYDNYINTNSTTHNYTTVYKHSYDCSSQASTIRDEVNAGAGWVNYTAHGSPSGWYSPSFSTSHISSMSNTGKYGLWIGNCCQTGTFDGSSPCFAEVTLRAQNKGAMGYIGASQVTYWNEDVYWAVGVRSSITANMSYQASNLGMYDKLFHTHNEAQSTWVSTIGGIMYGGNQAVQASSSSRKLYYWEIYHCFGDPSIRMFLGMPNTMTVVADDIVLGEDQYQVQVVPYAYVALKKNVTEFVCATFANASGVATLSLPGDLEPGTYELVALAQNYIPYFQNVEVIEEGGCISPSGFAVSNITPFTAALSWNGEAGSVYNVETKAGNANWTTVATGISATSYNLTNLQDDMEYKARVQTVCGSETSSWRTVTFTTPVACPVPTDVTCTAYTATTATLSWTENGSASTWVLQYGQNSNFTSGTYTQVTVTGNPTKALTGLTAETTYYARVKASCGGIYGQSQWSETCAFMPSAMQTYVIGDNTTETSNFLPSYSYYNYSFSQQIYTSDEITAGTIKSIAFKNTSDEKTRNYSIYLQQTDKESFSGASDWEGLSGSSLVFSGELTFATGEWTKATFSTPFIYDGSSNLLVTVVDNTGSWSASPHMDCLVYGAVGQALYVYNDNSAYNAGVPSASGTLLNVKNQILMDIVPDSGSSCFRPKNLAATNVTATSATLSWMENGSANNWVLQYGTNSGFTTGTYTQVSVSGNPTKALTGLTSETQYYARVKAICGANDESAWSSVLSFMPSNMTVIGSGAANSNVLPTNNYYNYSLTQQIYTPAELGDAGSIQSVAFYKDNTVECNRNLDIYMVSTTKSSFASGSDWITVSAANKVFSGTVSFTDNAWTTITLNTPFSYNGTSNVAIIVDDNTGSYKSNTSFLTFNASNQALRIFSDGTNYDATSPSSYSGTVETAKNQIRLSIERGTVCEAPTNLAVVELDHQSAMLNWNGEANSWKVAYKTSTASQYTEVAVNTNSYNLTGLQPETAYMVKVAAVCGSQTVWCDPINFNTLQMPCDAPTNLVASEVAAHSATLTWTANSETTEWVLQYGTNISFTTGSYAEVHVSGTPSANLVELTPETQYYARVKTVCGANNVSEWSNTCAFLPTYLVVIGSGTGTNSYLPTNVNNKYSLTQQIYTVSELGEAGNIVSIDFLKNNNEECARNLDIYMVYTDKGSFTGTNDWIPVTDADKVFGGTVNFADNDWTTITLDRPFSYDGTRNIAIMVDDNSGRTVSATPFLAFPAGNQALRICGRTTNYRATTGSYTGTIESSKNQIRIMKVDYALICDAPADLTVSEIDHQGATVNWSSEADSWIVAYRPANAELFTEVNVNTTSYTLTGLDASTNYTVKVAAKCGNETVWGEDVNFTTLSTPCPVIVLDNNGTYTENFDNYTPSTTAATGVEPDCWEVINEDVALTEATMPQVYYNAAFATSGSYTLRMKNRCVYAMPALSENIDLTALTMTFNLRQPKTVYRLQVGVINAEGEFEKVKEINNSGVEMEEVTVDFSGYNGNGHRIAFRNSVSKSSTLEYSINYIDDIVLSYNTLSCGMTLPYAENFDLVTSLTVAETGAQPDCWEVFTEDVALNDITKPQAYYNASYATSGSYTLRMKNRCTYAMPALSPNVPVSDLTMTFNLRQPNSKYRLQVGVLNDEGEFTLVKTFKCSGTSMQSFTVDFSNYTGTGHRIAFRNTLVPGTGMSTTYLDYSVNYIDDINIGYTEVGKSVANNDAVLGENADLDVEVYPNPTKDVVNVQCTMNNVQCMGIEIVDVYGKIITTVNQPQTQINVSGLAAGMYFVRVTTDRGVVTKPFVKR